MRKLSIKKEALTETERIHLCRMIGTLHTNAEIIKWSTEVLDKPLTQQDIWQYRNSVKWEPLIKKVRDEYLAYMPNLPMANKMKRVEELTRAYERARGLEENSSLPGMKLDCIDREVKILDQLQKEMEPKSGENQISNNYFVTQVNKFEAMSREEFELYRLDLVDKIRRFKQLEGPEDAGLKKVISV